MPYSLDNKEVDQEVVNRFLDEIREIGKINMFGVHPHVAKMFNLAMPIARQMTAEWMRTFHRRHPDK